MGSSSACTWRRGGAAQARHLRDPVLNHVHAPDEAGIAPGRLTPEGPEPGHRSFQMKPFLAQGAWIAARALNDTS